MQARPGGPAEQPERVAEHPAAGRLVPAEMAGRAEPPVADQLRGERFRARRRFEQRRVHRHPRRRAEQGEAGDPVGMARRQIEADRRAHGMADQNALPGPAAPLSARRPSRPAPITCFLAVRPPLTYHLADIEPDGRVREFRSSERSDMWINAGYFLLRPEIFDYMNDGEEFVLEPFSRLIEANQIMAYKHEGFWRCMDNLKDRQLLEEMVERGQMPWRARDAAGRSGRTLSIAGL
jgi:hypothetical protein